MRREGWKKIFKGECQSRREIKKRMEGKKGKTYENVEKPEGKERMRGNEKLNKAKGWIGNEGREGKK